MKSPVRTTEFHPLLSSVCLFVCYEKNLQFMKVHIFTKYDIIAWYIVSFILILFQRSESCYEIMFFLPLLRIEICNKLNSSGYNRRA